MLARVLRVERDGPATTLVAQLLHSNAVLKCAVHAGDAAPEQLRAGQTLTLALRACCPPDLAVSARIVAPGPAEPPPQTAASASKTQHSAPARKRPCFA